MSEGPLTYPLLAASAFAAGVINSVAGGGTLLTFPSLLAVISPVAANATSTIALLPGTIASSWGYRREADEARDMLSLLWLPSLAGGLLGSLAVTRFPERIFENLVPWLLFAATALMLLQKPIALWIAAHPHAKPRRGTVWSIVFFQFLVGIYGGYFGAGIGILMLSSLGLMGIAPINRVNAVKSILASIINAVTVVIFVMEGVVAWRYAIVMAIASVAGGYLGARVARRTKPEYVRAIVILVGFSVAAYSFYRRWLSGPTEP